MRRSTRREFLTQSLALSAIAGSRTTSPLASEQNATDRFLGTVPLSSPNAVPLNRLLGAGLDAALFTDLSTLTPESLVTPSDRFYVRTACPDMMRGVKGWTIQIGGLVRTASRLAVDDLSRRAENLGACLLECSGNGDPNNFGLMSSATWQGVRLMPVLNAIERLPQATYVRVRGVDHDRSLSGTSVPGASWIFSLDQLSEAFLATGMNGTPLPPDHGAPVRLVVPGWYGCTCIKWVDAIDYVDDREPSTGQMLEFAGRTHQRGQPALARDFLPATIDQAAMPVRVEHWATGGSSVYRLVGIVWGGQKPSNALEIRFRPNLPFVKVDNCPLPPSTRTWSLWTHQWKPDAPGRYEISLRITDPVRTRRLDLNFYRRALTIQTL